MIDQLYFEEHPWDRVCAAISQRNLGKVYEIAVQAVCGTGRSRTVFETWLARSEALTGSAMEGEVHENGKVLSYVGRNEDCILRIFVDESDAEITEDFEIVTEKALFVWKPGTSLQGRITGGYIGSGQKFVCDLEAKA